jgi:hypothetical protein
MVEAEVDAEFPGGVLGGKRFAYICRIWDPSIVVWKTLFGFRVLVGISGDNPHKILNPHLF